MRFKNSIDEQETTINIFPKSFQQEAEIYTSISSTANKILKLAKKWPEGIKIVKLDDYSLSATVPPEWLKIQKPKEMNVTEEQRQKMRERLNSARKKRYSRTV